MEDIRRLYLEEIVSLKNIDDVAAHLFSFLNSGCYVLERNGEDLLVETKQLVGREKGLKIEIRQNEHPPPHFHVYTPDIQASFKIDNLGKMEGSIDSKNFKLLKYWYFQKNGKKKLIEIWNSSRPTDCVVGEYKD